MRRGRSIGRVGVLAALLCAGCGSLSVRVDVLSSAYIGNVSENLRALTVVEPPRVERIHPEGVETIAIQGQGWGSALILVPEVLRPILGEMPRVLLAPVRNTLVALPDDVDPDLAFRMWDAIAEGCHDELDLNLLRWTGTTVVADGDEAQGLPN